MSSKKELRKLYLEKRNELSDFDIDHFSRKMAEEIVETFNFDEISCLHVFLASTRHREVNTWKLINLVRHRYPHVDIVIPQANYETREMKSCLLESDTSLVLDKYGIPEPEEVCAVDDSKIDLVIVPLVVADKKGGRVGYGKGFYDQFLNAIDLEKVKTIGLSYFSPVDRIDDLEPHDVCLQYLLTPTEVIKVD